MNFSIFVQDASSGLYIDMFGDMAEKFFWTNVEDYEGFIDDYKKNEKINNDLIKITKKSNFKLFPLLEKLEKIFLTEININDLKYLNLMKWQMKNIKVLLKYFLMC